jgi:flavin-dependent dehydrogenase
MTAQSRLPEGQPGPDYLVQHVKTLPGGPDLTDCEPVGRVVLSRNYPLIRRNPAPEPGLALVGDAAITGDPTPATGITWALRSARWLSQTTSPALVAHDDLAPALASYRRLHARISRELFFQRSGASKLSPNPVQRLMFAAGTVDPEIAWRVSLVGSAVTPPTSLLRPAVLLRALRARRTATNLSRRAGPDFFPSPRGWRTRTDRSPSRDLTARGAGRH